MAKHILSAVLLSVIGYLFSGYLGADQAISSTVAITLFTAYLWISEVVPIPIASTVPFIAFPLAGVLTHKQAASALGSHVIVLLMGAFMLAKGIESSGVHRRLAHRMIQWIGNDSAFRIILAFMLTTAFLSIWISNTASVLALLPVAATIATVSENKRFQIALLLGLAYSASLGGVGSLIGTPPNVIFASVYEEFAGKEYGFLTWMKTGVVIVVIAIPIMALWLSRGIKLTRTIETESVGSMTTHEKRALLVFGGTALLWVFRKEPFGGWSGLLGNSMIGDSTIALLGVFAMFLVSTGKAADADGNKQRLLDWDTAKTIPWGMLLLFSGGICIAKAFVSSGLSEQIGVGLAILTELPVILMLLLLTIFVSFLTEITSNTATATLLMPILASAAISNNVPLELLMVPAVISCSCAFCLPVATAPNSIVFAGGNITIRDMAREGVALNIIVAVVVSVVSYMSFA